MELKLINFKEFKEFKTVNLYCTNFNSIIFDDKDYIIYIHRTCAIMNSIYRLFTSYTILKTLQVLKISKFPHNKPFKFNKGGLNYEVFNN
jgi:hypothetical protein